MNICVFCSSSNALETCYFEEAFELAKRIAENGHRLVYGGANVGLMHHVADTVLKFKGTALGIIPQKIFDRNLGANYIDELVITNTMDERKAIMRDRSDAFIALPGGFGTLEEILEVLTLKQLDYHRKPIVFINTNGFYNDLFAQFEKSYEEQFAKENYRKMYYIAENAAAAMEYIETYEHQDLGTKWFNVPVK
jgi:cytokinin riboside 5'-monophosphate phosphoribohydrolase